MPTRYMLAPEDDSGPDPYFDPAAFFCSIGDYDNAAHHLSPGDDYRKGTLGLDGAGAAALRAALAPRGMVMADDGSHWVFLDASVAAAAAATDDDPPSNNNDEPITPDTGETEPDPRPCPICGEEAVIGRITCGKDRCVEEVGRRERAARRRKERGEPDGGESE